MTALADRARVFETLGLHDRALADLDEAARQPADPRPWVARGKLLAERGLGSEADVAYAKAAAPAPGRLDPFLEAGWWAVGPYFDDMSWTQPPEQNPDPVRPVAAGGRTAVPWKRARVHEDHFVDLSPFSQGRGSSVHACWRISPRTGNGPRFSACRAKIEFACG